MTKDGQNGLELSKNHILELWVSFGMPAHRKGTLHPRDPACSYETN